MKPSTELFELIKSLTKSEKRYFNLTIEKGAENRNYLKLFREILNQENYDEKAIKLKFRDEKFIKQLTFTKAYLYNLIIRSLIAYNYENSIEPRLLDSILKIKLLYKKALFDQYFNAIRRVKQTALQYEKFYILAELLRIERLVVKAEKFKNRNINKLYIEEEQNLQRIRNLGQYSRLFSRLMSFMRKEGMPRNSVNKLALSAILKTDIMRDESRALSVQALEYFYHIKMLYCSIAGDTKNAYKFCNKRLQCIEKNPRVFLDDIVDSRRSVILTLMLMALDAQKFNQFDAYFIKYKSLVPATAKEKISFSIMSSYISLKYSIRKQDYISGIKNIPAITESLKKYKDKIDKDIEMLIMLHIVILYFMAGKYEEALEHTNALLNNKLIGYRDDVQSNLKLLNLLIHYELKNYDLLEYLLESTRRFLDRKGRLYKIEFRIIKTLKKLCKAKSDGDMYVYLINFRNELLKLKEDPEQKPLFQYFDYLNWAESKLALLKR